MSARIMRPRQTTAVAPATVSQLTSTAILGIDERRFLEMLVPRCERVTKLGHLRLVEIDEALRVLRSLSPAEESDVDGQPSRSAVMGPDEPGQFESVDDVLAALGRRRVKGANQ